MVINSTVWQCEATGRENLTYAEALKSEKRAKKKIQQFKETLRAPVMLVIEHAKQSSINALNSIVFRFMKRRFFRNEVVQATTTSSFFREYTVVDIVDPSNNPPASEVYEEPEKLHYKLRAKNSTDELTVPFNRIKRLRLEFSFENLSMFVKSNVNRVEGILRPKPNVYQEYVTDKGITFSSLFIGKMPHFTPAKIKRPAQEGKKQSTINNQQDEMLAEIYEIVLGGAE